MRIEPGEAVCQATRPPAQPAAPDRVTDPFGEAVADGDESCPGHPPNRRTG
jgi:hypothetical protein